MIEVGYKPPFFVLTFIPIKKDLDGVRDLPVRGWDKDAKHWLVPRLAVRTLSQSKLDLNWSPEAIAAREKIEATLVRLVDLKFKDGESRGKLRPYQAVGVEFLVSAKKALLADDMGLGKTIQAIQALIDLEVKKALIVVPASLKWKWYDEFKRHFNIEPTIIAGTKKERAILWKSDSRFIIANYDLLLDQRDWDIMPHEWSAIVADEAVYLKNPKSFRTKKMKKLKADVRIALSGIYIENGILEFQSIMEWVRPEITPPMHRFMYRYIDYNKVTGEPIGPKKDKLPELHLLTSPFILRREKTNELKELPPKINIDVPLEFSENEKKEYAKLSEEFKKWLESMHKDDDESQFFINGWDGTIPCRQFVEFPDIVLPDWTEKPTKLEWLEELHESVDKIVVFSFFKESIKRLAKHFNTPYIISGDIPPSDRFSTVQKFNGAKKAILVSTDAGKFGLDLVGADTVVHYGYEHNPGTMIQREDRLWRMGQKNIVNVMRPYLMNTIDLGIIQVYESRLGFAKSFMEQSDDMAKAKLSMKDFLAIIEGKYQKGGLLGGQPNNGS